MTHEHCCEECGAEVTNPSFSLEMTGKYLCPSHLADALENSGKLQLARDRTVKKDRFSLPNGISRGIDG